LDLVELVGAGEEREQRDDLEHDAADAPHVHLVRVVAVGQQALGRAGWWWWWWRGQKGFGGCKLCEMAKGTRILATKVDTKQPPPRPPHTHTPHPAAPVPARRDVLGARLLGVDAAARPKVGELERVVRQQDVLGLDVAVEDAVAVFFLS
jgi:hypothetical protein